MEFYFVVKAFILLAVFFGIIALLGFTWKVLKVAIIVVVVLAALAFLGKIFRK